MSFEITVLIQLSAIPTEEKATELSSQVFELVHETICDSDIPDGDLVVSNGGITEYDDSTGETVRTVYPPELPSEEAQQKIRHGINREER